MCACVRACFLTRALMSSDLYMSIRISSGSPLKIAWMSGGCGEEEREDRRTVRDIRHMTRGNM